MVSVLILTRNEEQDLPGCLHSVRSCRDVHVFDSLSSDRTREIAEREGATVHQRPFDSYASQRNAALETIRFRFPWVLVLDADERATTELWREASEVARFAPDGISAFRVRRNDYFLGQHLRHAQIMPWYTRLLRLGHARYARSVNEVVEVDGTVGQLEAPLLHYPFAKGLDRWFERHNQYSAMEASIVASGSFRVDANLGTALFHPDFHTRRRAQKAIFYLLPCRPLLRWLYLLVARRGLLDGRAGVLYATLQAIYEWQIVLKTRELEAKQRLGPCSTCRLPAAAPAPRAKGTRVTVLPFVLPVPPSRVQESPGTLLMDRQPIR